MTVWVWTLVAAGDGVHGEAVGLAVGFQPLTYLQRKAGLVGGIVR